MPTFLFGFLSAPKHLSTPRRLLILELLANLLLLFRLHFKQTLLRTKGKSLLLAPRLKTKSIHKSTHAQKQLQLYQKPSPSELLFSYFIIEEHTTRFFFLLSVEIYSVNRFLRLFSSRSLFSVKKFQLEIETQNSATFWIINVLICSLHNHKLSLSRSLLRWLSRARWAQLRLEVSKNERESKAFLIHRKIFTQHRRNQSNNWGDWLAVWQLSNVSRNHQKVSNDQQREVNSNSRKNWNVKLKIISFLVPVSTRCTVKMMWTIRNLERNWRTGEEFSWWKMFHEDFPRETGKANFPESIWWFRLFAGSLDYPLKYLRIVVLNRCEKSFMKLFLIFHVSNTFALFSLNLRCCESTCVSFNR